MADEKQETKKEKKDSRMRVPHALLNELDGLKLPKNHKKGFKGSDKETYAEVIRRLIELHGKELLKEKREKEKEWLK